MSLYAVIDDIAIPAVDVLNVSTTEITREFAGSKLISSKSTIQLNNIGYAYDKRPGTNGIFETMTWYNRIVQIYDDETEEQIWEGRLKKIEISDGKRTVTLTVNDYIQDIVDTTCVCNLLSVTTADAIYGILTDAARLNIPESRIIMSGIEIGISMQQNMRRDVVYTASNNVKCISVLERLCRESGSYLYQRENKIGYWIWEQYTGVLGMPITAGDILAGEYSQNTDDENIFNEFSVAYDNSGTVAYATDTDDDSAELYGSGRQFAIPEDAVDSTSSSDFNILYESLTAANNIIALLKSRYSDIREYCEFTVKKNFSFLNIGDVLDLRFSPFIREPVVISGIKPDRAKKTFALTCEKLNYPKVVDLDLTAPDPVMLFQAVYYGGSIYLKWTKSTATDLTQYKLYFSTSRGHWGDEFTAGRFSPDIIPVSFLTYIDSDCFYEFTPPEAGKTYWFKVTAVDDSYNESENSNIISVRVPTAAEAAYENIFNLDGDPFNGFTLDPDNPHAGEGLDTWAKFDTAKFNSSVFAPTAMYESPLLYREGGFTALNYKCLCGKGDIQLQYRIYSGGMFGSWSEAVNAAPFGFIDLTGAEYFQYRIIYNSPFWTDTDEFILREIV